MAYTYFQDPARYYTERSEQNKEGWLRLMQMMIQAKQLQEQRKQQEFENALAERRTGAYEKNIAMQERGGGDIADFEKRLMYFKQLGLPDQEALFRATGQYQQPLNEKVNEVIEKTRARAETSAKYKKPAQKSVASQVRASKPQYKRDVTIVNSALQRYDKEIERLSRATDEKQKKILSPKIDNLKTIRQRILSIQGKLAMGNALDKIDREILLKLNTGIEMAKKDASFWWPDTIKKAVKERGIPFEQAMKDYYEYKATIGK